MTIKEFVSGKGIKSSASGSPDRHPNLKMPRFPFEELPANEGVSSSQLVFPPYLMGAWIGDGSH